jgi:hypothetical protein
LIIAKGKAKANPPFQEDLKILKEKAKVPPHLEIGGRAKQALH